MSGVATTILATDTITTSTTATSSAAITTSTTATPAPVTTAATTPRSAPIAISARTANSAGAAAAAAGKLVQPSPNSFHLMHLVSSFPARAPQHLQPPPAPLATHPAPAAAPAAAPAPAAAAAPAAPQPAKPTMGWSQAAVALAMHPPPPPPPTSKSAPSSSSSSSSSSSTTTTTSAHPRPRARRQRRPSVHRFLSGPMRFVPHSDTLGGAIPNSTTSSRSHNHSHRHHSAVASASSSTTTAAAASGPFSSSPSPSSSSSSSTAATSTAATTTAATATTATTTPPSAMLRSRPRSNSVGGTRRAALRALLDKAVILHAKAMAAKAQRGSHAPPTNESIESLTRLVHQPEGAKVALQLLARAVTLYSEVFGARHASVAAVYKLMGCILAKRQVYDKALDCFQRALELCEGSFGPQNTITMDVRFNIALVHLNQHRFGEATMHLRHVLSVYSKVHGPDAAETRFIKARLKESSKGYDAACFDRHFDLAVTCLGEQRPVEAERHFRKCLLLRPREVTVAYSLACCECLRQQHTTALTWLHRSVAWGFRDVPRVLCDADIAPLREEAAFWGLVLEYLDVPDAEVPPALLQQAQAARASQRACVDAERVQAGSSPGSRSGSPDSGENTAMLDADMPDCGSASSAGAGAGAGAAASAGSGFGIGIGIAAGGRRARRTRPRRYTVGSLRALEPVREEEDEEASSETTGATTTATATATATAATTTTTPAAVATLVGSPMQHNGAPIATSTPTAARPQQPMLASLRVGQVSVSPITGS